MIIEMLISQPFRALVVTYLYVYGLDLFIRALFNNQTTISILEILIMFAILLILAKQFRDKLKELKQVYYSIELEKDDEKYKNKHGKLIVRSMFLYYLVLFNTIITVLNGPLQLQWITTELVCIILGLIAIVSLLLHKYIANKIKQKFAKEAYLFYKTTESSKPEKVDYSNVFETKS